VGLLGEDTTGYGGYKIGIIFWVFILTVTPSSTMEFPVRQFYLGK